MAQTARMCGCGFGPGHPSTTAIGAIDWLLENRDVTVRGQPSLADISDRVLVDAIRSVLAQVHEEALALAMADPAFAKRVAA